MTENAILLRLRALGARETAKGVRGVADASLDVRDAQLKQQKAAEQLNGALDKQETETRRVEQVIQKYGRESREAREAQERLARSQRDAAEAAVRLERAQEGVSRAIDKQDDSAGGAASGIASLTKKAGALAAAYVGVEAVVSTAREALDRDYQSDLTAGALGLSPRLQRRAGRAAAAAYADGYGESIAQVNEAIVSVGQNITRLDLLRPGVLGRLVRRSLNIATVFGPEVGEVTRIVGDQLRNGLVRNTEDAFDLITVGFQRGANRSDELLDTLREYAEPVRSLGLDARDFMNILVAGADAGVYSSDRLGDALKELSIRAVDGSATTRAAYKALGLDARETAHAFAGGGPEARRALVTVIDQLDRMGNRVQRERVGVNLFGAIWEDVGWKAIRSLNPARDALGRYEGAARRLDRTISEGPQQTMDRFFRKLKNDSVEVIGGIAIPLIEGDFSKAWENFGRTFRTQVDGITLGLESLVNSSIQIVNELIDTYNFLPDFLQRPTHGDQIDRIPYIGAYGERLLDDAAAAMPQIVRAGPDDDPVAAVRESRRRRREQQRPDNPLGAVPTIPIAPIRPRARTSNIDLRVNLDGRVVARNTVRHDDDDEQWR